MLTVCIRKDQSFWDLRLPARTTSSSRRSPTSTEKPWWYTAIVCLIQNRFAMDGADGRRPISTTKRVCPRQPLVLNRIRNISLADVARTYNRADLGSVY